jgi:DMSO reductase anchor subunit
VIVFTTASGAGYGLLVWLAIWAAFGHLPQGWRPALLASGLALGLVTAGLLSSTAHLGRPERAWRAFSQWQTSWLSREGVAAVATFLPAGLFALRWLWTGRIDGVGVGLGVAMAVGALITVWCTGMIYASLTTIRAWCQPIVAPLYIVLGLGCGAVLLNLVLAIFSRAHLASTLLAVAALVLGLLMKLAYWRSIDLDPRPLTAGDATGLRKLGTVRPLEPPHTMANYVMREMGYTVARKHAESLRRLAIGLGFAVPAVLLIAGWALALPLLAASLATVSAGAGILVERWLFFAEAQHVVTLFYGAERA